MTRVGLLLSGVTPLSGVLHQLGGGVMLPKGCSASRMAFMKQMWSVRTESNCPQLCLLRAVLHPIRRHCTSSDRVHSDGTGASRRNGCSASRVALVKQAWSASVTDSGCGRGWAWKSPMLTTPVCASRSYVRQRSSTDAPEDNKQQGRCPSRVARAPPIAVRTWCDHRAAAAMAGVHFGSAAGH